MKEQREYLPAFACREELMKVVRENQGRSGPMIRLPSIYISIIPSRRRGWGDRIGKDDPIGTISLRGRLLSTWDCGLYSTAPRCCDVGRETC